MGRCKAGQPKVFSRKGTHGVDYASANVYERTTKSKRVRREKEGTYTTFTHTHWFGAPFIVNGALELEKPWVRQITEPPIGCVIYVHLRYRVKCKTTCRPLAFTASWKGMY
jgi:hypothetical protein